MGLGYDMKKNGIIQFKKGEAAVVVVASPPAACPTLVLTLTIRSSFRGNSSQHHLGENVKERDRETEESCLKEGKQVGEFVEALSLTNSSDGADDDSWP